MTKLIKFVSFDNGENWVSVNAETVEQAVKQAVSKWEKEQDTCDLLIAEQLSFELPQDEEAKQYKLYENGYFQVDENYFIDKESLQVRWCA